MKLWSVLVASSFYTDEVGVSNKVFLLNFVPIFRANDQH